VLTFISYGPKATPRNRNASAGSEEPLIQKLRTETASANEQRQRQRGVNNRMAGEEGGKETDEALVVMSTGEVTTS
jgi:hypothetical protein